MVSWCIIEGCRNNNKICKLHVLPSEPKRFQRWIEVVNRLDITIDKRRNYYVCHDHFSKKQKVDKPGSKCKTYLRYDAMPDINLPGSTEAEEVLHEPFQSDVDRNDVILSPQPEVNPVILNNFCGLCCNEVEGDGISNMMTTIINQESSVNAFKVIESISTFKYSEDGPQFLCSICFYNITSIYEFQEMCNRVHENKCVITPQLLPTLTMNKARVLPKEAPQSAINQKINSQKETTHFEIPVATKFKLLELSGINKVQHDFNKKYKLNYRCKYCRGLFPDKMLHDRHLRIVHEKHPLERKITRNLYSCPYCSISFAFKESLTMHLVVHSGHVKIVNIGNEENIDMISSSIQVEPHLLDKLIQFA